MFSLGDRAYGPQFCSAGRKLAVRLLQLGAVLLCEAGYGDDGTPGGGVFADLDAWVDDHLLVALRHQSKRDPVTIKENTTSNSNNLYRVRFSEAPRTSSRNSTEEEEEEEEWRQEKFASSYLRFFERLRPSTAYHYNDNLNRTISSALDFREYEDSHPNSGDNSMGTTSTEPSTDNSTSSTSLPSSAPLLGRVVTNQRLTALDWEQDTRHIRLEIDTATCTNNGTMDPLSSSFEEESSSLSSSWNLASLPYRAGDVASVLPSNTQEEVERLLRVLPTDLQNKADCILNIEYLGDSSPQSSQQEFFGVGYPHWPETCTLRGWLTHAADIHGLPAREDLWALSFCCSNRHPNATVQRDKLRSLSETSGAALYTDYILREKRSWVDVIHDFDALRAPALEGGGAFGSGLTVESLLALFSPLRSRDFSIASSPTHEWFLQRQMKPSLLSHAVKQNNSSGNGNGSVAVELCVAVVEGKTPLGRTYHGLCSHYLSQRMASEHTNSQTQKASSLNSQVVRLWIRPGSFSGLPLELSEEDDEEDSSSGEKRFETPVLYVGAGTGIAPLRGLIHEREAVFNLILSSTPALGNNNISGKNTDGVATAAEDRDNILVFGCRKENVDFYYEEEWKEWSRTGRLGLFTAFSRDQARKIYVQTLLRPRASNHLGCCLASHILDTNGFVYIAGGPKMARAVKEEIVTALASRSEVGSEKQANRLVNKLQRLGHFRVEAWS